MKIRLADLVVETLVLAGIKQAFSVTGGASMHLNDAAGSNPKLDVCYLHHEQSCAMAAEGYARLLGEPALVMTTAGPGALNTLNGVFGAFTDSMPMIVLAGQARTNTLKRSYGLDGLRQLGDQEVETKHFVQEVTKASFFFSGGFDAKRVVEITYTAFQLAVTGRKGPVWIEIPVDLQGLELEIENDEFINTIIRCLPPVSVPKASDSVVAEFLDNLFKSHRPVILLGTGVLLSRSAARIITFAEKFDIPVLTAWTHDQIDTSHRLFIGRPGTIGDRAGNLVVQNCDFLLVLGSRLNIRQISYSWSTFAPGAYICQVDIDENEITKPFPKISLGIHSDINEFLDVVDPMVNLHLGGKRFTKWLAWSIDIKNRFNFESERYSEKPELHNPYIIIRRIFENMRPNTTVVCGDATACIVPFQTGVIRDGIRMFSNSGSASMGYDLPAAIGAAIADATRPVVCFAGDGSIMMNLQELQSIKSKNLDITIFVLSNDGYLSIKQTQRNFFARQYGCDPESGIEFPKFEKVGDAFGLYSTILDKQISEVAFKHLLQVRGPKLIVVPLDPSQEFQPRIKSRIIDGQIQTPSLDDMHPYLDSSVLALVRSSAKMITN